jgi:hypothetical protein
LLFVDMEIAIDGFAVGCEKFSWELDDGLLVGF